MNIKTPIFMLILLVLFVMATMSRYIILGSAKAVTLPSAPMFTGIISQALGTNSNGSLLAANKDYDLGVKYFNNRVWVIAFITPKHNEFDPSVAVLKKSGDIYQVIISPTNALPSSQLKGVPADVASYLSGRIAVYSQ